MTTVNVDTIRNELGIPDNVVICIMPVPKHELGGPWAGDTTQYDETYYVIRHDENMSALQHGITIRHEMYHVWEFVFNIPTDEQKSERFAHAHIARLMDVIANDTCD